jgi:hypothetical protein
MGGGGLDFSAITNPVGYARKQLLGSNNAISRMTNSPISGGAAMGKILNKMSTPGNPNNGDVVNALPFDGSSGYEGQAYDQNGRPILKNVESQLGADGMIKSQYQTQNTLDPRAMTAARQEYLRPAGEMSKWGQMAMSQQQNQGAQQRAGQLAQSQNQLAMQGGLRSGARERLAGQSMVAGQQGQQNALQNVQMQDETNRQKWLQMAPDMEMKNAAYGADIQNQNINRSLSEVNAGRGYDLSRYEQAMKGWAAEKSSAEAQAQARSAKESSGLFGGGGFLGLGF